MNGVSIVSDTNPLIYLLNGSKKAASYLDGKQVWISAISELELYGKKGLTDTEKREIDFLTDNCIIAELNNGIKERTKKILQILSIKLPDAIIAATALYLDLPLLTFDSDFARVPGLKLFILEE
jgi:predicted nucleic acid-binding protein